MSRQLEIIFDQPQAHYYPGDTITGHVVATLAKQTRCKSLTVECYWQTHGRGNRAAGEQQVLRAFEGVWEPGTYRYAFAFELPVGPFSYHGHHLNVDWYVRASADVPWAFDPSYEVAFLMLPPPEGSSRQLPLGDALASGVVTHANKEPVRLLFMGCASAVFLSSGLACVGFGFLASASAPDPMQAQQRFWIMAASGALVLLIGMLFLVAVMRRLLSRQKLGKVHIQLEPAATFPGGRVHTTLSFTPGSAVALQNIRMTLKAVERVVQGHGTRRTTYRHTVLELMEQPAGEAALQARSPFEVSASFALPEGAPCSFSARDNNLTYFIEYHVDIARWPDWKETRELTVSPRAIGQPRSL